MIVVDGKTFITAQEAHEHLGDDVTEDRVWDWQRRHLVTGYLVDRTRHYDLDALTEVEYLLRTSRRGRHRRARPKQG